MLDVIRRLEEGTEAYAAAHCGRLVWSGVDAKAAPLELHVHPYKRKDGCLFQQLEPAQQDLDLLLHLGEATF